jgi:hypothetical protein
VSTGGGSYLTTRPVLVTIRQSTVSVLPTVTLSGGDVNGDNSIDLTDLVRTAAEYQTKGPIDGAADVTGDGVVNLFDLVLISTNFGARGPEPWAAGSDEDDPGVALPEHDLTNLVDRGPEDGVPVALVQRWLDEQTLAVDVVAEDLSAVYGSEISLLYDREQVTVVDTSTRPGVQVQPGSGWEVDGSSYVAVNEGGFAHGEVKFVASRTNPSGPMVGDQVLVTVTFRVRGGGVEDAFGLSRVELRTAEGVEVPARWIGVGTESRSAAVFVPFAIKGGQR